MKRRQRFTLSSMGLLIAAAGLIAFRPATVGGEAAPGPAPTALEQELERLQGEGVAAVRRADFPSAQQAFQAGLGKAKSANNRHWTAIFHNSLGGVYFKLGQFDQALAHFRPSFALRRAQGSARDIAVAHNNLGVTYGSLGRFEEALEQYSLARQRYEAAKDRAGAAIALQNRGLIHLDMGFFDRALADVAGALEIHEAIGKGDAYDIAFNLRTLGLVYQRLGRYEEAKEYLNQALELQEPLRNPQEIAHTLNTLGNVYSGLGQNAEALKLYHRSLELSGATGSRTQVANALNNLGNTYDTLGDLPKALQHYSDALAMYEALGNPYTIAGALNNVGNIARKLRRYEDAQQLYTRSLQLQEALGIQQDRAVTYVNLAILHEEQGRLDEAEAAYARAVRDYEAVSSRVGDPGQAGAYQQIRHRDTYARYAALRLRRGQTVQALAMAERGRAQGLARQAAMNRVNFSSVLAREDATRLQTHTTALVAATKLLAAAASRPEPSDAGSRSEWEKQKAAALEQHEGTTRQLSRLRDTLYARYPAYAQIEGHRPPEPEALLALAKRHPDTLFLEWVITGDQTAHLFTLSHKDGVKSFPLSVGRTGLEELIKQWRERLVEADREEPRVAAIAYRAVLGPVEAAGLLKPKRYARLVLVPDGPLGLLPWAALQDGAGKRLVERFPLAASVSLGALTWPRSPRKPEATLMCAVDPVLGPEEPLKRTAMGTRRGEFPPLRHARAQAAKVAVLFPGTLSLAGSQAREAVVKQKMRRYRVLHFATHGVLDPQDSLRSRLLLAREPRESLEDGRLEAREIAGLPLSADLAVLSACHTAEGKVSGGEGPLGMAWAFRAAGCRSVVASLWAVDEQATGRLMETLYRAMKAGRRKDEALRAAMLAVRQDPETTRAFYWAAFQVIGDTAALTPAPARASRPAPRR